MIVIRQQKDPTLHQKQCHLSGVSRLYYLVDACPLLYASQLKGRIFSVPWDKDKVITERPHLVGDDEQFQDIRTPIYPANFWDDRYQDHYPHGFAIHAHCWSFVERIIGPSAENQLDLFLQVLSQRWEMKPRPFEVRRCIWKRNWMECYSGKKLLECLVAILDPMDIPEIKALIHRCTQGGRGDDVKGRSSSSQNLGSLDLPLDIIHHIFDHLRVTDIESILIATQWQVPSFYWRSRFPRKLIFEIEELTSAEMENVNWQVLCLEVEKLIEGETSRGLQNRRRIYRILEGTKELFLSQMLN